MIECRSEESKTGCDAAADKEREAARRDPFPSNAFREPILRQLASQAPASHKASVFPATAFRQPILDLLAKRASEQ